MSEDKLIRPSDPSISYSGRIDFRKKDAPRFDWPGITISMNFTGKYVKALFSDGGNDYNVFIDGKQAGVLATRKDTEEYVLARGLNNGPHNVTLTKRTEGYDGIAVFRGFVLPADGGILPRQNKAKMKIEFIGDSITVGFGVEGKGVKCGSERDYKNNYLAYSQVLARMLGAEAHIVAVSGRGVVKNYGEKVKKSRFPLPYYYDKTLMNDKKLKWDFKAWKPDAVIINLGTNDVSTKPVPEEKDFVEAYLKLIKKVRKAYGRGITLYCVSGPDQTPPSNRYISKVVKTAGGNIRLITARNLRESELGCDWHPNIKGADRIAKELYAQIANSSKSQAIRK